MNGKIKIWDFHLNSLLHCIIAYENYLNGLYSICLWNNNYLMAGAEDKSIKIIDLNKGVVIGQLEGHKKRVIMVRKFTHPKYGEFLVSQSYLDEGFKLWV